jgi:hypothetical protein
MEMNHGYCTTPDGRDIRPFKFDNTREGMDKLWGMVMASKNRFKCEERRDNRWIRINRPLGLQGGRDSSLPDKIVSYSLWFIS